MATTAPKQRAGDEQPETTREAQTEHLRAVFRELFRSFNRLRGRDTHLGVGELSHAQFELLMELADRGPLPAGELAGAARLTPGTVTQMLDHLAAEGHVERVRSQTDRRVVVSRLTAQGRRRIEAKRRAFSERWELALAGVGSEELRAATNVLQRVCAMLEDAPPTGAPESPEIAAGAGAKRGSRPSKG